MLGIKRILVVDRLTQDSRDALMEGLNLAKTFGADLSVLRIFVDPVDMEALNAPTLFFKGEEYRKYLSVRDQYKEEVDEALRQVSRDRIPVKEFVTQSEPVGEVLRIVKQEQIDLVVVLAHEEGRLEHLLFGGENDALVRRLPCSILLVKREPEAVSWEIP